ncbi:hypothetical protein V1520DRAFT_338876 [Lipomyces starkeyi]|uniref:Uncharacterized protein n=1 Tax=Lipomyces starkeyi NRRL Y-11557 TaxID=675824 RepID=A0A1E3PZT0_LIPST|nr:hypothetical protein LIPSTDRAFT_163100 [Lipomyces starkeyi NRRL Y-11557]
MDMSPLSSHLPPSSGKGATGEDDESQLLSTFKAAAVAVTKLYRAANQDISRAKDRGYLEAIDDVLAVIASGQDVYEWAVQRKFGTGVESNSTTDEQMGDRQAEPKQDEASQDSQNHDRLYNRAQQQDQSQMQRSNGMDFTMAGAEFTFRSGLQLDRSQPLPSDTAIAKNARDILMITPDDMLFHAVSAQLEEEQRIEQDHVRSQQLQQQQQESYQGFELLQSQQNMQSVFGTANPNSMKRRTVPHSDQYDLPESKLNFKRHRY